MEEKIEKNGNLEELKGIHKKVSDVYLLLTDNKREDKKFKSDGKKLHKKEKKETDKHNKNVEKLLKGINDDIGDIEGGGGGGGGGGFGGSLTRALAAWVIPLGMLAYATKDLMSWLKGEKTASNVNTNTAAIAPKSAAAMAPKIKDLATPRNTRTSNPTGSKSTTASEPTVAPKPAVSEPTVAPKPAVSEPTVAPKPAVSESVATPKPSIPDVSEKYAFPPEAVATPKPAVSEPTAAPKPTVPKSTATPKPAVSAKPTMTARGLRTTGGGVVGGVAGGGLDFVARLAADPTAPKADLIRKAIPAAVVGGGAAIAAGALIAASGPLAPFVAAGLTLYGIEEALRNTSSAARAYATEGQFNELTRKNSKAIDKFEEVMSDPKLTDAEKAKKSQGLISHMADTKKEYDKFENIANTIDALNTVVPIDKQWGVVREFVGGTSDNYSIEGLATLIQNVNAMKFSGETTPEVMARMEKDMNQTMGQTGWLGGVDPRTMSQVFDTKQSRLWNKQLTPMIRAIGYDKLVELLDKGEPIIEQYKGKIGELYNNQPAVTPTPKSTESPIMTPPGGVDGGGNIVADVADAVTPKPAVAEPVVPVLKDNTKDDQLSKESKSELGSRMMELVRSDDVESRMEAAKKELGWGDVEGAYNDPDLMHEIESLAKQMSMKARPELYGLKSGNKKMSIGGFVEGSPTGSRIGANGIMGENNNAEALAAIPTVVKPGSPRDATLTGRLANVLYEMLKDASKNDIMATQRSSGGYQEALDNSRNDLFDRTIVDPLTSSGSSQNITNNIMAGSSGGDSGGNASFSPEMMQLDHLEILRQSSALGVHMLI